MERVVVWSGGINRRLNRHRAAWSEAAAGAVWRAGCVGTERYHCAVCERVPASVVECRGDLVHCGAAWRAATASDVWRAGAASV